MEESENNKIVVDHPTVQFTDHELRVGISRT